MTVAFPRTLTPWDFRKQFTLSEETYGYFLLDESWNSIVFFFDMPHILKAYNILSELSLFSTDRKYPYPSIDSLFP